MKLIVTCASCAAQLDPDETGAMISAKFVLGETGVMINGVYLCDICANVTREPSGLLRSINGHRPGGVTIEQAVKVNHESVNA